MQILILHTMSFTIIKMRRKQHVTIAGIQLAYFVHVFTLITSMSKKQIVLVFSPNPPPKFEIMDPPLYLSLIVLGRSVVANLKMKQQNRTDSNQSVKKLNRKKTKLKERNRTEYI